MSDTMQGVSWALERPCPFRSGDEWYLPHCTRAQLADLRTVAHAAAQGRVFKGICVTSCEAQQIPYSGFRIAHLQAFLDELSAQQIPYQGFLIDHRLQSIGGLSQAWKICGKCEANAKAEEAIDIAGCFGFLYAWPDSHELERVLKDREIEQQFFVVFPRTRPIWYGLWISSPLQEPQVELLRELLQGAFSRGQAQNIGGHHFLNALQAAKEHHLPLHVSMAPPGHVDFGWYTVFPHCPRCKAEAPLERWQSSYPKEPHTCRVCSHVFIPAEHYKSERDDSDPNSDNLEQQMGTEAYWHFVRAYLLHQGRPPQRVEEIIEKRRNK
jgi:hypothetical protein